MLGMRIAGARRPIDRLKPHQAHQTTGPATTEAHALAAQMTDHLTGAVERILQEQLINAPHQRQGLRALALGRVIERGASDRQQTALTAQAQRRVSAYHHRSPLGPAHRTGPSRQKIPLHRQLADLRVKITDLALMVPTAALAPVRKHSAKTIDRLALPCAHLVRMNLVLRGDLLKRPVATKRLKRDLRLQLPGKPASLTHRVSLLSRGNTP